MSVRLALVQVSTRKVYICCFCRMSTRPSETLSIRPSWNICGFKWQASKKSWKNLPSNTGDTCLPSPHLSIPSVNASAMTPFAKQAIKRSELWNREDVRKDPIFRAQFHTMCANVGVDPLASNKGMWAQLLGFGDFYYELGVQVVEACLATRSMNGGLMDLDSLRASVTVST